MILIKIRLYDKSNKVVAEPLVKSKENKLIINDTFIQNTILNAGIETIEEGMHAEIFIDGNNINIGIDKVTIFKKVFLRSFGDKILNLGLLSSINSNIHVVDVNIKTVRTDSKIMLFANCNIENFYINLNSFIDETQSGKTESNNTEFDVGLHNCQIKNMDLYCNSNSFIISSCQINEFKTTQHTSSSRYINTLIINNNSIINCFRSSYAINRLHIEESEIDKMIFGKKTKIDEFISKKAIIQRPYHLDLSTFTIKNYEAWNILKKSSINDSNHELFKLSSYEIAIIDNSKTHKLINWFLRESVGYGYKPHKAIKFILLSIIIFGAMYFAIDSMFYLISGEEFLLTKEGLIEAFYRVMDSLYLSGITFTTTGFGDVAPGNFLTRLLSVFEACLGVSILSLLIFSLTKSYIEKRET